jgi:NADP-dependent aldehyde dehydrogenase
MRHGGPCPRTTAPLHTSVGAAAIDRFLRLVSYQNMPDELLPEVLREADPHDVSRLVDGTLTVHDRFAPTRR